MLVLKSKNRLQDANEDSRGRRLPKSIHDINPTPAGEDSKLPDGTQTNRSGTDKNLEAHPPIILHIDDDPEDRELVHNAIRLLEPSFIVVEAEDAKSAIEYLKSAKNTGLLPSLIILDINMPGMDGFATHNEIKKDEDLKQLPTIIFSTGNFFRAGQKEGNEELPIFTKPEKFKDYVESVRIMLTHRKEYPVNILLMEGSWHVSDPLGSSIKVEPQIYRSIVSDKEKLVIKGYITKTVQNPTQVIQVNTEQLSRYYFKIINEEYTLLLKVNYYRDIWQAHQLFENPPAALLNTLLQYGTQLL